MTKLRKGLSALLLSAFMTLGVGIGIGTKSVVEGKAATKTLIIDGSKLSSTATSSDTTLSYDNFNIVFSKGAKQQSSSGTNKFSDNAILIGKNNTYIYNKDPIGTKINSFKIYSNKGASQKVIVGVCFSEQPISSYNSSSAYTATLSKVDNIYDATSKIGENSKYFWYQVTNAYNSQVQFQITYEESVVARTLESINLSGTENIEFYKDDAFNHDSVKVTAHYSETDVDDRDVSSQAVFTAPDMTTAGTKTVNVSYTEGEVTLTASYDITVKEYAYTGDGTLENPFTIEDAIFKAKQVGTTATTDNYYVKGTIATKNFNTNNYKLTFEGSTGTFTFYYCYADTNNGAFKNDILSVGDEVIGCGKIVNYKGNTPELDGGCYLYDYKATGITASEPTNSGFAVGQTITVADLGTTVTADIEITGEKRDVTSEAHITSGLPLVKGDNTLTISYTQTNKYSGVTTNNSELTTTVVLKNVVQKAESVKVTASSDYVNIGETISLSVEVLPESTNDKTVVWSSLNSDIATVDENTGVVAGVKVGKATIKATCGDVFGTIEIDVKDPTNLPKYLTVEGTLTTNNYFVGETFDPTGLTASVMYSDAETIVDVTNDVTWNLGVLNDVGDAIQVIATYTFDNNGTSDSISSTDNVTIKVVERVLDAIVVDGIKTTYTTDDKELDLNAMKVEASYVNCNRYIDVTDKVSIEGSVDFSKLEKQTIYVVYSEGGITEKEAINITVTLANMTIKVVSGGTGVATYELVTSADQLKAGDQIVIALAEKGKMMGDMGTGKFLTATDATFDGNKITSEVSYYFTLSGGSSAWTFTDVNGKEVGATAVKTMAYDKGTTSWTIAIDSDNKATITCGSYGKILYNVNNPRFLNYNSDTNVSMLLPEIYKLTGGQTVTEYTVSEKLYTAIQEADAALVCGNSSTGTWVDGTYDVETAKGYLEMTEAADLEALKGAQADENGNMVEKFLWKYDYLVATGKIENFLNRTVVSQARVNPFITNVSNETTIAIIVIVSLVSVSVIGGYFFIRKRKEQ